MQGWGSRARSRAKSWGMSLWAGLGVGPQVAAVGVPGLLLMCPSEDRRAGREGACIGDAKLLQLITCREDSKEFWEPSSAVP